MSICKVCGRDRALDSDLVCRDCLRGYVYPIEEDIERARASAHAAWKDEVIAVVRDLHAGRAGYTESHIKLWKLMDREPKE